MLDLTDVLFYALAAGVFLLGMWGLYGVIGDVIKRRSGEGGE